MKCPKYLSTCIVAALTLMSANLTLAADAPSPKYRIERDFKLLETSIARCIYEDVLSSPDIEFMNRALHGFMRENPSVTRMLRVNAGGYTVNDVSADSPHSAPPRNISSQRWFQHVMQGKTPYYSMDVDAQGQLTLFYAWPLSVSSDGVANVTGTYAAAIDFTSQVALIDDAPPFRVVFRGKPVFEHEWEDIDFNEEPLAIKGARDLAIRTLKPLSTRLDPSAPTAPKTPPPFAAGGQEVGGDGDGEGDVDGDGDASAKTKSKKNGAFAGDGSGIMSKVIFALLVVIALMLGYSIFGGKRGGRGRNGGDGVPRPVTTLTMMPVAPPSTPLGVGGAENVSSINTQVPEATRKPDTRAGLTALTEKLDKIDKADKEQEAMMTKMMDVIKEEFEQMDNKMEQLSQRLDDMEMRQLE